jgi:hypothetical protein
MLQVAAAAVAVCGFVAVAEAPPSVAASAGQLPPTAVPGATPIPVRNLLRRSTDRLQVVAASQCRLD